MILDQLKKALEKADPAAVLVPSHLLARVIREVHDVRGQGMTVPHRKSLILDRAVLFRHVELDDLDLGPDRQLPTKVILIARPSAERRSGAETDATLLRYWRRLFHANVHLALERRVAEGRLTDADVEARVAAVGRVEFDEVRTVLQEEQYLFPQATTRDVYLEFAAVYLELRFFLPDLLPVFFPALRQPALVDEVLAADVDASALFARTRLGDVPEPSRPDASDDEPSETCWKYIRAARRAEVVGNTVRAAIFRTRAARIAPAARTQRLRAAVQDDLDRLTQRLQLALKLGEAETLEWRKDLPALLDKTGDEQWSVEARLLYDLQKACVENEREVYALDVVEWLLSAGKRPLKKPLTNQRLVRITRHLHSAEARLNSTRLSEADRQHLGRLLNEAARGSEERLRARFRPVLADALYDVGLQAGSPPEQAAQYKMIEELLDRVVELGFFTFSDLRDAISRNNLKLPDLADPQEWLRGDPLLRLDRRLAAGLDGVYRPSEIYLRALQRLTSANFGTRFGRLLTRYVTIPLLGALLLLQGADVLVHSWQAHVRGVEEKNPEPYFGPASVLARLAWPPDPAEGGAQDGQAPPLHAPPWVALSLWALGSVLLFMLLHVPAVRRAVRRAFAAAYRGTRLVLVDWPARVLPLPALRHFLKSWPGQLLFGLVLKPLLLWSLLFLAFTEYLLDWRVALLVFVVTAAVVNSRPLRSLEDAGARGLAGLLEWLRSDLLYGLVRLVGQFFKRAIDAVEYVLYSVDEWLRFHEGDGRLSQLLRGALGVLWFPVSYALRVYLVVLLEPGINPIKLPLSILAAKFVYPIILTAGWEAALIGAVRPHVGDHYGVARVLAWGVVLWWLPDAFAFLIWEMKENWKLYKANRPEALRPVGIGRHGETLLQLLKPGFHSGQVPKLYAQWRKAEREAHEGGSRRPARACRERMHALEEDLAHFVEREVLALLHQAPGWRKAPLRTGAVELASNLARIELDHAEHPDAPLRVALAEQGGRLVARVEDHGWVRRLTTPDDFLAWTRALAGLYKLAGVDVVAEEVQRQLPPATPWALDGRGLTARFGPFDERVYDLDADGPLVPRPDGPPAPTLDPEQTVFARVPILWQDWVDDWSGNATPAAPPGPAIHVPAERSA